MSLRKPKDPESARAAQEALVDPIQQTLSQNKTPQNETVPQKQGPCTDAVVPCDLDAAYSVFLPWQKRFIFGLVLFGGWFSSISSFIYFPAIPTFSADLHASTEQINLTVTSYLIMSGIFPALVGNAADRFGRRPVFITALGIYVACNVGLALQSSFAALFVLRMVQAAGISGTFSVSYGVLGDLVPPADRGVWSGAVALIFNTPPSTGPLIAGLLLLRWGWKSIFWFLVIASGVSVTLMVLFLPETSRDIVGNGSLKSRHWAHQPIFPGLNPKTVTSPSQPRDEVQASNRRKLRFPNPLKCLMLLRFPGTIVVMGTYAAFYVVYTCLQASLSSLFVDIYHVSGLISGLTYLPFGVAVCATAFATGHVLDRDYRRTALEVGMAIDKKRGDDMAMFPIEKARMRTVRWSIPICAGLIAGYGWSLQARTSMAVPLVLLFLIGVSIQGMFTAMNTLIVDMHQNCPSTAHAANNLLRGEAAAAATAALDAILKGMGGPGWTFVFFGALVALFVPLIWVLVARGLQWRQKRAANGEAEV